jgi:hypothetical protein
MSLKDWITMRDYFKAMEVIAEACPEPYREGLLKLIELARDILMHDIQITIGAIRKDES